MLVGRSAARASASRASRAWMGGWVGWMGGLMAGTGDCESVAAQPGLRSTRWSVLLPCHRQAPTRSPFRGSRAGSTPKGASQRTTPSPAQPTSCTNARCAQAELLRTSRSTMASLYRSSPSHSPNAATTPWGGDWACVCWVRGPRGSTGAHAVSGAGHGGNHGCTNSRDDVVRHAVMPPPARGKARRGKATVHAPHYLPVRPGVVVLLVRVQRARRKRELLVRARRPPRGGDLGPVVPQLVVLGALAGHAPAAKGGGRRRQGAARPRQRRGAPGARRSLVRKGRVPPLKALAHSVRADSSARSPPSATTHSQRHSHAV